MYWIALTWRWITFGGSILWMLLRYLLLVLGAYVWCGFWFQRHILLGLFQTGIVVWGLYDELWRKHHLP